MHADEHENRAELATRRVQESAPPLACCVPAAFGCGYCDGVRALLGRREHESAVLLGARCDVCRPGLLHAEVNVNANANSREMDET